MMVLLSILCSPKKALKVLTKLCVTCQTSGFVAAWQFPLMMPSCLQKMMWRHRSHLRSGPQSQRAWSSCFTLTLSSRRCQDGSQVFLCILQWLPEEMAHWLMLWTTNRSTNSSWSFGLEFFMGTFPGLNQPTL